MLLTIDIGNTTVSVGVYRDDLLVAKTAMGLDTKKTSYQFKSELALLLGENLPLVTHSIISSVVPTITATISAALLELTETTPIVVSAGVKTGLKMKLSNSVNLGSDLVCAAVGAVNNYPLPAIVVDLGTASTITGIDNDGVLCGTSIMAGVEISLTALNDHTAALPLTDVSPPEKLMGMNTKEAIKSGAIYGTASMVDGMCKRYEKELTNPSFIITGGYAKTIAPFCEAKFIVDQELIFKGLNAIFSKNTK